MFGSEHMMFNMGHVAQASFQNFLFFVHGLRPCRFGTFGGDKRVPDPQELELLAYMPLLGTKLQSSEIAKCS